MFALATTLWKRPGVDHFVDTPGKCYSGLPRYMHSNRQCRPCDFSELAENRFSDFRLRTPDVESEHEVLPLRCPTMKNHAYLASKGEIGQCI